MGWADHHIATLRQGETVSFRPRGNSMLPLIKSGELVTAEPITDDLAVGDIVLCSVAGRQYLHLIKAIQGKRYQIANNRGHINGWCTIASIYGRVVAIEE